MQPKKVSNNEAEPSFFSPILPQIKYIYLPTGCVTRSDVGSSFAWPYQWPSNFCGGSLEFITIGNPFQEPCLPTSRSCKSLDKWRKAQHLSAKREFLCRTGNILYQNQWRILLQWFEIFLQTLKIGVTFGSVVALFHHSSSFKKSSDMQLVRDEFLSGNLSKWGPRFKESIDLSSYLC